MMNTPKVSLELALQLSHSHSDKFAQAKEFRHVPFYGELYHYTYGQDEVDVKLLHHLFQKGGKKRGLRFLEVFAGSAYDSGVLQFFFPENEFVACDISDSMLAYQKFPNIQYNVVDAVNGDLTSLGKFDVVFGGVTNASHSDILTMDGLYEHSKRVARILNDKGLFIVSATGNLKQEGFYFAFAENKIRFGKGSSSNLTAQMMELYTINPVTDFGSYFNLVVILDAKGRVIDALYADDHVFRSWSNAVVIEVVTACGFNFIKDLSKISEGLLAFTLKR